MKEQELLQILGEVAKAITLSMAMASRTDMAKLSQLLAAWSTHEDLQRISATVLAHVAEGIGVMAQVIPPDVPHQ